MTRTQPLAHPRHETELYQIRHERTAEAERLDKLKATLELKLQAVQSKPGRQAA